DEVLYQLRGMPAEPLPILRECLVAIAASERFMDSQGDSLVSNDELPMLGQIREYQLVAKLGEGGMGAVYKALHTRLKKVVAIKVLPSERTADPMAVSRFEREMEAVGK